VQILQQRLKADHGALTRLINPERGFKTLPTASATIKGFEVMRTIRKRLCLMFGSGTTEEVRFVNVVPSRRLTPRLGTGRMRMGLPMQTILEISGGLLVNLATPCRRQEL
jgi:DDE domain